ncbi:hypothetical protein HMPREF9421_0485 [Streptococcus australis ATCC 700641]|uniref:Uncharacterized protein n=1 Tax=Streptococcus australis ATCC 700641 TaxID=888833 RepID=E7S8U9_9STRE|nr:hypothetical protein HMPREF9421_0485 [Streptococcus australis ATCC 700641]
MFSPLISFYKGIFPTEVLYHRILLKNILTSIFSWILWPDTKEKVEILTSRLFSVAKRLATCFL